MKRTMKAVIGLAGLVLLALSISRIKSYYDLKSLIKSSREYNFPLKIKLILSNNKKAFGLKKNKK